MPKTPPPNTALIESEVPLALKLLTLWQYRRLVAAITGGGVMLALLLYLVVPAQYVATAVIIPNQKKGQLTQLNSLVQQLAPELANDKSSADIILAILRSRTTSERVIEEQNLLPVLYGKKLEKLRARLAQKGVDILPVAALGLNRRLGAKKNRDDTIVFSVSMKNRSLAKQLADAYLRQLGRLLVETVTTDARRQRIFIEKQIQELEQSIKAVEEALLVFSEGASTITIDEGSLRTISKASEILTSISSQQIKWRVLNDLAGEVGGAGSPRAWPADRELNSKLEQAKQHLADLLDQARGKDGGGQVTVPLSKVPILSIKYIQLKENYKLLKDISALLRQQYELTKISEAREEVGFMVIDKPIVPPIKVSPSLKKYLLVGTVFGFLAALAFLYLKDLGRQIQSLQSQNK